MAKKKAKPKVKASRTPVMDSIVVFAKRNGTTQVVLSYAKYTKMTKEWMVNYKAKNYLNLSVPDEDRWVGIFARIDNVDLFYDGSQDEDMRKKQ